jgi:hypothetical protein
MVIAYHSVFTTYGTWLPNDPRGCYSKQVYQTELRQLAEPRYGRQSPQPDRATLSRFWTAAQSELKHPPYFITEATRPLVAQAFGETIRRLGIRAAACAIMNDHVHLVLLRSKYRIEYAVGQLKGAATHALGVARSPWSKGPGWHGFLNDWQAVGAAIQYVEANPPAAGLPRQQWDFVQPLPDSAW